MPIYLMIAYIVFLLVPIGLAASIVVRRRRMEKEIAALESQSKEAHAI